MLVFIDESGDSGIKFNQGSSKFFTIALVIFDDHEEAQACDIRIEELKKELKWRSTEFHFKSNSNEIREKFLMTASKFKFQYYAIVIDKTSRSFLLSNLSKKVEFYNYTCRLVFENAKGKISNAIIHIDESGGLDFRNQLSKFLRSIMNNTNEKVIKKIKIIDSRKSNLIQLADYIASSINRSYLDTSKFRKILSKKEILVEIWPK